MLYDQSVRQKPVLDFQRNSDVKQVPLYIICAVTGGTGQVVMCYRLRFMEQGYREKTDLVSQMVLHPKVVIWTKDYWSYLPRCSAS